MKFLVLVIQITIIIIVLPSSTLASDFKFCAQPDAGWKTNSCTFQYSCPCPDKNGKISGKCEGGVLCCGIDTGRGCYCPTSGIEKTDFSSCGRVPGQPCHPEGSPCVSGTWQYPGPDKGFQIGQDQDGNPVPIGDLPRCVGPDGVPLVAKKCCGEIIMEDNQCCLPNGKVVPAYPVQDFSECPDLQQDPAHPPTSNGCGPAGSKVTIPQSYLGCPLGWTCNRHDKCYSTCKSERAGCDDNFMDDMLTACVSCFPGFAINSFSDHLNRNYCELQAVFYATAVSQGGSEAYTNAQKESCRCCK